MDMQYLNNNIEQKVPHEKAIDFLRQTVFIAFIESNQCKFLFFEGFIILMNSKESEKLYRLGWLNANFCASKIFVL